jgi:DprA winged helix domain
LSADELVRAAGIDAGQAAAALAELELARLTMPAVALYPACGFGPTGHFASAAFRTRAQLPWKWPARSERVSLGQSGG